MNVLTLGLAPALVVEEAMQFGPLAIAPLGGAGDEALAKVAARYASKRGAHPSCQAVVTCPVDLNPLVQTIWSLFVFACVSRARRQAHSARGVAFPENFHLLPLTSSEVGLIYDTGQSLGIGGVEHVPLRWPVDRAMTLNEGEWDRRIELACTLLAKDPAGHVNNPVTLAAGMAADLANAAMERRNQRVEHIATGARTCVLLASAFEALHCKGSDEPHSQRAVVRCVRRLRRASTRLGERIFSEGGLKRPPKPEKGKDVTRPMFAVAQILYLRNTYVHGRVPAKEAYTLPNDLNGAHVIHAAMLILAVLIGDDLLRDLDCIVPGATTRMSDLQARTGLPFELIHGALMDDRALLASLEKSIVPSISGN
jgi:hypothetical protein